MTSNAETNENDTFPLSENFCVVKRNRWEILVEKQVKEGHLKARKCSCYSAISEENLDADLLCICGRLARRHSFTGDAKVEYRKAQKWTSKLTTEEDITVYGQLNNGARFIRCYMESDETLQTLANMIADDVGNNPKLLVSCYGGAQYFKMTDKLEREFLNGIAQVAATKDVWLLTTGLNSGVSKLIGKGVRRNKLLNGNPSKTIVIGLSHWGTLSEYTQQMLKSQVSSNKVVAPWEVTPFLGKDGAKAVDKYHTHFLLSDDGKLDYLTDDPRSDFVQTTCNQKHCYAVTIIVEGGINSLEVITNDLKFYRPVVIVHGSGRLADVLGNLLEGITDATVIGEDKINQQLNLDSALWPQTGRERDDLVTSIARILEKQYRRYLSVFRLGSDTSLTNTIFRAIFKIQTDLRETEKLLELTVTWNCLDGAQDIFKLNPNSQSYYPKLFEQALKEYRPLFVDYFLRGYHNPLETTAFVQYKSAGTPALDNTTTNKPNTEDEMCVEYALQFIVEELYKTKVEAISRLYPRPQTFNDLKRHYSQIIGLYAESFYDEVGVYKRFRQELKCSFYPTRLIKLCSRRVEPTSNTIQMLKLSPPENLKLYASYHSNKPFGKQEMLRDLFLWSVYTGYADIAFVLLLQLKSRMGAVLIAAGIAERLSLDANNLDIQNTYDEHRIAYEEYAVACIGACYKHNEQFACQLLLREIPLFGNITCMQAAIASRNISFINTDCFDEVLNRQWYGHLDKTSSTSLWVPKLLFHLLSFGVLAPFFLSYRRSDNIYGLNQKNDGEYHSHRDISEKPWIGIEDQSTGEATYWQKFDQFHASPVTKVFYQFLIYVWFLLVFSYLMLFHIQSSDNTVHWTEIYLIIAVSAALLEDIRKLGFDFYTQMTERWHKADIWILGIYALPYVLFYIGIGLHFGSFNRPDLFTAARIVLAIDLEIWFLFSLRFASAIKLWGPKLFMIRNMMQDLVAFIFIIFVCIAAYGVVSTALTAYSSVDFTAQNISSAVFYRPYWFLYSIVDDEKKKLDAIISSDTNSDDEKREAIVTHILLAFHMLFINILILNLLIAVFNFSINDVQAKNKYFWRYQRYELIREYFEKPTLAYPPVSLIIYIYLLIKLCMKQKICLVFKRLATTALDKKWTEYESEATYQHARTFVEVKYRLRNTTNNSTSFTVSKGDLTLQEQVYALDEKVSQIHYAIGSIQEQMKQMILSVQKTN